MPDTVPDIASKQNEACYPVELSYWVRGREIGKKQMKISALCRQSQGDDMIESDEGASPV